MAGYRALALSGMHYARRVIRRQSPLLGVPVGSFAMELALALRPQFFAFSAVAALAGAASSSSTLSFRVWLAAVIGGLGWGVGQLVNDLLDLEADAVNAPDRAIVSGRLPPGPALAFAVVLGVVLAVGTAFVHPRAWVLALVAVILLISYNAAKRWPLAGNVSHGALVATAAAIGALAAQPSASLVPEGDRGRLVALFSVWPTLLLAGGIAAWYLQGNYEKDRRGDRAAGYTTLAVVLSVRGSAIVRALGMPALAWGASTANLLVTPAARGCMIAAVLLGLGSTLGPIARSTDLAALRAYPAVVVASITAMIAIAAPALGTFGTTSVLLTSLLLVAFAFRRSSNP